MSLQPDSTRVAPSRAPSLRHTALAAVLAGAGALLAACGGGGGGGDAHVFGTDLSAQDVAADAANGSQIAGDGTSTVDNAFDTIGLVSAAAAQGRTQGVDGVVVDCAGGGTATVTITGGALSSELDGQFSAGEHVDVQFSQCRGRLDLAQLDGETDLDITTASYSGGTRHIQAAVALNSLTAALSLGSVTYSGNADLDRTVVDGTGGGTTSTTHLTSDELDLTTSFHSRTGHFQLQQLDVTRLVDAVDGVPTQATMSGHQVLAGTAFGRTFSIKVATDGQVAYGADGTPTTGSWTAVHGHATVGVQLAGGQVTVTYDRNSDGTPERSWTFTLSQLLGSEG